MRCATIRRMENGLKQATRDVMVAIRLLRQRRRRLELSLAAIQTDARPTPRGVTALGDRISDVVCAGAEEQMCGIDAERSVAAMADDQPVRDRAVRQFPRNPMRPETALTPALARED